MTGETVEDTGSILSRVSCRRLLRGMRVRILRCDEHPELVGKIGRAKDQWPRVHSTGGYTFMVDVDDIEDVGMCTPNWAVLPYVWVEPVDAVDRLVVLTW